MVKDKRASLAGCGSAGASPSRQWCAAIAVMLFCSGCGWITRFQAPNKLTGVASANPLPPTYSSPPVEPPPSASVVMMPPAAPPIETPPPAPAAELPPATFEVGQLDTVALAEIDQLKSDLAALKTQQGHSQAALESLTASSLATASRAAAIEAHLALQSSLIDDLRTATQQQQREQWKALDAVSEGIDRMLKKSEQHPPPTTPKPHDFSPEEASPQEMISRRPGEPEQRALR